MQINIFTKLFSSIQTIHETGCPAGHFMLNILVTATYNYSCLAEADQSAYTCSHHWPPVQSTCSVSSRPACAKLQQCPYLHGTKTTLWHASHLECGTLYNSLRSCGCKPAPGIRTCTELALNFSVVLIYVHSLICSARLRHCGKKKINQKNSTKKSVVLALQSECWQKNYREFK